MFLFLLRNGKERDLTFDVDRSSVSACFEGERLAFAMNNIGVIITFHDTAEEYRDISDFAFRKDWIMLEGNISMIIRGREAFFVETDPQNVVRHIGKG